MRRVVANPNYLTFGPTETVVTLKEDRGQLRTNGMGEFFCALSPMVALHAHRPTWNGSLSTLVPVPVWRSASK